MNHLTIQHLPELPFEIEEAVNQLRVNLGFCGDQIKTVMITSSVPNEGKSFITMQLWRMMAEVGSRVLLIDCDLRKSEMRAKYGISSDEKITGIAHYLAGKVELPDAIYSTNVPNGFLMPLAASVANPSILLENPRFAEMIGGAGGAQRPDLPQAGGRRSGEAAADRGADPGGGPQPGGNGPERQPLLQTLLLQWVLQQRVRP